MKHDGFSKNGKPEFAVEDDDESNIDKFLGKSAESRIWQTLWEWGGVDGTKTDFANSADISRPSLYDAWPFFIEQEIIIPSRKVKGKQLYKMNPRHLLAKRMIKLINDFMGIYINERMVIEDIREKRYKKWERETKNGTC